MHRNANERGETTTKSDWLLRVSRGVGSSHLSRLPYGARSTLTPSITLDAPLCRRVARGNPPATISSGDSPPDAGDPEARLRSTRLRKRTTARQLVGAGVVNHRPAASPMYSPLPALIPPVMSGSEALKRLS